MYRNVIEHSKSMAFGCSHTWGVGVEATETWCYLLGAMNFGMPGVSADFVARTAPGLIQQYSPDIVYILWPDWTRFEYLKNNEYKQSLATDTNRIEFMSWATDEWLQNNFASKQKEIKDFCQQNNTTLIDITLYELTLYIDHADRWPLSKLGHHYSLVWHQWVADIFKTIQNEKI